jgi:hypothetical protein
VDVRSRRRAVAVLPALTCLATIAGCGGQGGQDAANAAAAAEQFAAAAQAAPATACRLLAPQTRKELMSTSAQGGTCDQALSEQKLPSATGPGRADVYGKDAIVHLRGDTVFLARFTQGWLVTAAGCTLDEPDRPYDCAVKGS